MNLTAGAFPDLSSRGESLLTAVNDLYFTGLGWSSMSPSWQTLDDIWCRLYGYLIHCMNMSQVVEEGSWASPVGTALQKLGFAFLDASAMPPLHGQVSSLSC